MRKRNKDVYQAFSNLLLYSLLFALIIFIIVIQNIHYNRLNLKIKHLHYKFDEEKKVHKELLSKEYRILNPRAIAQKINDFTVLKSNAKKITIYCSKNYSGNYSDQNVIAGLNN